MLNRFATLSCVICVCWAVILTGPAVLVALSAVVGAAAVGLLGLMVAPPRPVAVGLIQDTDARYCLPQGFQHVQAPPVVALPEVDAQICAPTPKRVRKSAAKVAPSVKAPRKPTSPRAAAKASRPVATAPMTRKRSSKAPE